MIFRRALAEGYSRSRGECRRRRRGVLFFATCPPYITGQILKVDSGESVTT